MQENCFKLLSHGFSMKLNSLWPSDAIWEQKFGSSLAQVMACCLMMPSHSPNWCLLTMGICNIHLKPISQEVLYLSIHKMGCCWSVHIQPDTGHEPLRDCMFWKMSSGRIFAHLEGEKVPKTETTHINMEEVNRVHQLLGFSCRWNNNTTHVVPAWVSNQMPCNVWDEITYASPYFKGTTVGSLGMDK